MMEKHEQMRLFDVMGVGVPMAERRLEAAHTDRLNDAHWSLASFDQHINSVLDTDLARTIQRIAYEAVNNPLLEGVIETHVADFVGPSGPTLDIQSDSDRYNKWLREYWEQWWLMPDAEGRRSGPEILDGMIRGFWKTGDFLAETVDDPTVRGTVMMRLKLHHSQYLQQPATVPDNGNQIIMGVEVEPRFGRPVAYHVVRGADQVRFSGFGGQTERIPIENMHHLFRVLDPGQVRGLPWASSCLNTIADIRDTDNQLLDAIRLAADFGLVLETEDPDAQPIEPGSSYPLQRRQMTTLPPGYKPTQVAPEHPGTNVLEFRDERLRELGRVVGMPLEKVKASAKDMNFSQTKHGQGNYWRCIEKLHGWTERSLLNDLVMKVEREARLSLMVEGRAVPRRPDKVKLVWTWDGPPEVDPRIEAMSLNIKRGLGALTITDILERSGRTLEQHIAREQREREAYAEAGLPYPEPASDIDAMALEQDQQEPATEPANA